MAGQLSAWCLYFYVKFIYISTVGIKKKFETCDPEGIYVISTKKESEFHVAP